MLGGFHHLHVRKRIYKELKAFPHPTFWKRMLDYLMYIVALATPVALLPQIIHLYRVKDGSALSWESFSLFFVINALWVVYASVHREVPLAISCILCAILDVALVYGILLYS